MTNQNRGLYHMVESEENLFGILNKLTTAKS